jgi:hypothetical protein
MMNDRFLVFTFANGPSAPGNFAAVGIPPELVSGRGTTRRVVEG